MRVTRTQCANIPVTLKFNQLCKLASASQSLHRPSEWNAKRRRLSGDEWAKNVQQIDSRLQEYASTICVRKTKMFICSVCLCVCMKRLCAKWWIISPSQRSSLVVLFANLPLVRLHETQQVIRFVCEAVADAGANIVIIIVIIKSNQMLKWSVQFQWVQMPSTFLQYVCNCAANAVNIYETAST